MSSKSIGSTRHVWNGTINFEICRKFGKALIVNFSNSSSYPDQHLEKIRSASTWQHAKFMTDATQTKEGDVR